jgi:hypothetical protein
VRQLGVREQLAVALQEDRHVARHELVQVRLDLGGRRPLLLLLLLRRRRRLAVPQG